MNKCYIYIYIYIYIMKFYWFGDPWSAAGHNIIAVERLILGYIYFLIAVNPILNYSMIFVNLCLVTFHNNCNGMLG